MNKANLIIGVMTILDLLSFLSFINVPKTYAASYGGEQYLSQGQTAPDQSLSCGDCPAVSQTCWNSQSVGVTNCGTACNGGDAWTRYNYAGCYFISSLVCDNYYQYASNSCSTADKYNSGNPPVLNAGFCDCSVGGAYKTCCANGTAIDAQPVNIDPYPPPEGQCGGGAAVVYCGQPGQPACGQAACATATPTPTPTPTQGVCPNYSPPQNTPQTVFGNCTAGTGCQAPCSATCTDNQGQTCAATSCVSYWACQGGTQWYNDGTYYKTCPNNCKNCQNGATQQTCTSSLSCTAP